MIHKIILIVMLLFFCLETSAQINFENNTNNLGINYSPATPYLGSGVSFADFDNDGWDDLSFASGNGQIFVFTKITMAYLFSYRLILESLTMKPSK